MTFALILSSPTFILAAEITSAQDVAVRVNREFGFTYTEQTDAYEGYVHNLDGSLRFNAKGTYDHAEYQLTYAPTVTLDFGMNEKGIALSLSLPT